MHLSYEYIAKWIVANYPNADQHEFYGEWVQGYASEDYAAETASWSLIWSVWWGAIPSRSLRV